ncbi:MAG: hypothetical protein WBD28_07430 [Candidatus Zixiibacteriota bacterium]
MRSRVPLPDHIPGGAGHAIGRSRKRRESPAYVGDERLYFVGRAPLPDQVKSYY